MMRNEVPTLSSDEVGTFCLYRKLPSNGGIVQDNPRHVWAKEVTQLAISKSKKGEIVVEYDELLKKSQGVIISKYGGLTMPQLDKVRKQMRDAKAEFHVTKNTLIARKLKEHGLSVPDEWLTGSTALSFCFEDAPAAAKAASELAKEFEKFSIVGGVLSGKAIDANQVKDLALMPSLDTLRAQLIGLLSSPASGIVGALNAAIGGVAYALQAKVEKEQAPAS